MNRIGLIFLLLFSYGCVPRTLIVDHPNLVSLYFEKKISSLENQKELTQTQKRKLLKTKVEYGYGILLEESDRLIDEDYYLGIEKAQEAYQEFKDAKEIGLTILKDAYLGFDNWLINDEKGDFTEDDIFDLYWLGAAYGGAIRSSRGNPFEIVNLPKVGKLFQTAILLNPDWGRGALYSAMMSYTSSRPDLFGEILKDSVTFYYSKAISASDSLDAGPFVSYAESIDKKFQQKDAFVQKLQFVLNMDVEKDKDLRLSNIIAQERAKWLLLKKSEYFLE